MRKKKKKANKIIQTRIKKRINGIERSKNKLSKELLEKTQIISAHFKNERADLEDLEMDLIAFLHGDFPVKIAREDRIERKIHSMIKEIEELEKKICKHSE